MVAVIKWFFLIFGATLFVIGLFQCGKLIAYMNELTEMGKGYFVGSVILSIVGIILIGIGIVIKRKSK